MVDAGISALAFLSGPSRSPSHVCGRVRQRRLARAGILSPVQKQQPLSRGMVVCPCRRSRKHHPRVFAEWFIVATWFTTSGHGDWPKAIPRGPLRTCHRPLDQGLVPDSVGFGPHVVPTIAKTLDSAFDAHGCEFVSHAFPHGRHRGV